MNESEWNELQRVWKSSPQQAEPVVAELERLRRGKRWSGVMAGVETIIAAAGLVAGIALIVRGGVFFVTAGVATCIYTVAICALSLWVRLLPRARPDDAVEHAVAVARRNALLGVRHATATIWALVIAMVFAACMALGRGLLTEAAALEGFVVIGVGQLVIAAWFALAFLHYRARSAALARLDAIAAALKQ
jgi:hypothetical protein